MLEHTRLEGPPGSSIAGSCPTIYENGGGHKDHQRSSLRIKCWEMVPNLGQARHTRRHPATIPGCTQQVGIDEIGTAHPQGFVLRIPYLTIFDVPDPHATDITLSTNDLSDIATIFYERLP